MERLALAISVVFVAVIAVLFSLGLIPPAIAGLYLVLSLITFALYGLDKSAAKKGRWRIAEARLHLFEVTGGWPGALLAQQYFRHKTRKQPFQFIFWCSVILNCTGLVWLVTTDNSLAGLFTTFASIPEAIFLQ